MKDDNFYKERVECILIQAQLEERFRYRDWSLKIPFIKFPADWEVRIIPNFGGSIARFNVKKSGMSDDDRISVYLDCYDMLGFMGKPYWEIYPAAGGDTDRFLMNDVEGLLEGLRQALDEASKENESENN